MRHLALVALLAAGCRQVFGLDPPRLDVDAALADAPDAADAPPDAAPICLGTAPFTVCVPATVDQTLDVGVQDQDIDTDGVRCITDPAHVDWCVIAAVDVSIMATFRAHGTKPLVLVATNSLTIGDKGIVDVSSAHQNTPLGAGANSTLCGTAGAGFTSTNGAGGGAGGSFGTRGGNGGRGDGGATLGGQSASTPPGGTIATLRGGCPGGAGGAGNGAAVSGGAGGGAVYLVAGTTLSVQGSGLVNASGAGGNGGATSKGGGAGGGSGGSIFLFAATISLTGELRAEGGGGGGGADNAAGGNAGSEPTTYASAASGGPSAGADCNNGPGCGGAGAMLNGSGQNGDQDKSVAGAGGGGGGGGAGLVHVVSGQSLLGMIAPSPR